MARVIKAGDKPQRPPTRVLVDAGPKKVIERHVFVAKQDAEHILMRAEDARKTRLVQGKKQAEQAREEAMTRGAEEAFALAATEALSAFRARAERYSEALNDIRALAFEVAKKVLGNAPDLSAKHVDAILARGLASLRARRRLRLQVGEHRLTQLRHERPNLMKALENEPDLVLEAVDDVNAGFVRVVTEMGGALCTEQSALDALAHAVNVHETPRHGGPLRNDETRVQAGGAQGQSVSVEHPRSPPISATAAVARRPQTPALTDDIEEIEAEEDDSEGTGPMNVQSPALGAVIAPKRPATRAVALPLSDDEELDLYADDLPRKSR